MIFFFLRLLITTVAIVLCAQYLPGLIIKDLTDAIFFGLVLGLINAFLRPFISFFTVPLNVLTLGLFSLVVNAFTFWLASKVSYGVAITDIWGAVWGGALIWLISILTNLFIKDRRIA
jgi:putative membrane protein